MDQIPGEVTSRPMVVTGGNLDSSIKHSGESSLQFAGQGSGQIADSTDFDFTTNVNISFWIRPSIVGPATLLQKGDAWKVELLTDGRVSATAQIGGQQVTLTSAGILTSQEWSKIQFGFNLLEFSLSVGSEQITIPSAALLTTNDNPSCLPGIQWSY